MAIKLHITYIHFYILQRNDDDGEKTFTMDYGIHNIPLTMEYKMTLNVNIKFRIYF